MEELLDLLKDGHARKLEMLANELNTDMEDIRRKLEYLEHIGVIKITSQPSCGAGNCSGCALHTHSDAAPCKGCLPEGGFKNMGDMWEVVEH